MTTLPSNSSTSTAGEGGVMNRVHQVDQFVVVYAAELENAVRKRPEMYGFGLDCVPIVVEKMRNAFYEGSYIYDSHAIRATCKVLGIKHTRKAMEAFFNALDSDPLSAPEDAAITPAEAA